MSLTTTTGAGGQATWSCSAESNEHSRQPPVSFGEAVEDGEGDTDSDGETEGEAVEDGEGDTDSDGEEEGAGSGEGEMSGLGLGVGSGDSLESGVEATSDSSAAAPGTAQREAAISDAAAAPMRPVRTRRGRNERRTVPPS
ncbi:MAG TPA: hypothetical protein VIG24_08860 [Acidimicrobiia bacterium]